MNIDDNVKQRIAQFAQQALTDGNSNHSVRLANQLQLALEQVYRNLENETTIQYTTFNKTTHKPETLLATSNDVNTILQSTLLSIILCDEKKIHNYAQLGNLVNQHASRVPLLWHKTQQLSKPYQNPITRKAHQLYEKELGSIALRSARKHLATTKKLQFYEAVAHAFNQLTPEEKKTINKTSHQGYERFIEQHLEDNVKFTTIAQKRKKNGATILAKYHLQGIEPDLAPLQRTLKQYSPTKQLQTEHRIKACIDTLKMQAEGLDTCAAHYAALTGTLAYLREQHNVQQPNDQNRKQWMKSIAHDAEYMHERIIIKNNIIART